MRVIGVTGGVGAGKSTVLGILEEDFQAYVIQADQLGHILMEPGEECYDAVIALFGKEIIKKRDHPSGCKAENPGSSWRTEGSRKRDLCCGSCSFSGRELSGIL